MKHQVFQSRAKVNNQKGGAETECQAVWLQRPGFSYWAMFSLQVSFCFLKKLGKENCPLHSADKRNKWHHVS